MKMLLQECHFSFDWCSLLYFHEIGRLRISGEALPLASNWDKKLTLNKKICSTQELGFENSRNRNKNNFRMCSHTTINDRNMIKI